MKQKLSLRTHTCGELGQQQDGETTTLNGWVHRVRNLGAIVFLDLRDRWGITQVVFDTKYTPESVYERSKQLRLEDVVSVSGMVALRQSPNPAMKTGLIEIRAEALDVFSKAGVTPFPIAEEDLVVNEDLRSQYRYLDMRKGKILANLVLRHSMMQATRRYMTDNSFIEVTTPILAKSTPEGARDYLVPSRVYPGNFYALPQSPQMFKQLLMVGGLDRYFQLATCFRDEDLRADRQPEFHQIDIEMSFGTAEEFFPIIEGLLALLFSEGKGMELPRPFRRMTYREAVESYGCDKPDLRFGMPLIDASELVVGSTFPLFQDALHSGGIVRGLNVKNGAQMTRKQIDEYTKLVGQFGFKGLAWIKWQGTAEDGRKFSGPIAKWISLEEEARWIERFDMQEGDHLFLLMGQKKKVLQALDHLRRRLGKDLALIQENSFAPLWVVDFPLFAWNDEEGRIESEHHPFTSPHFLDIDLIEQNPLAARSSSYDLVVNGYEIASGSQRIHDRDLQDKIFSILGMDKKERVEKFGFFIEALGYGTPPHLGIALGFDRIIMIMTGTENIRDVVAFPKNQRACDVMTSAPSAVSAQQLGDLHILCRDAKV